MNRFILTIIALALMLPAASGETSGPPLRAGVSLGNVLTWGRTNRARTEYASPVYEGREFAVPVDLLRKVKACGFDFIRLTVDPGPFIALKGTKRDALDAQLLTTVKEIEDTGLDVLVDFHPIHMVKAYAPDQVEGNAFPAYAEMIRRSAKLLARLDLRHIAIEPMNEPQSGYTLLSQWRWQKMAEQLYDAAHAASPDLTVVITGGRGGNIDGLVGLDPGHFKGGNVRYSFHYYLPYTFTMQGVIDKNASRQTGPYIVGLPYPAMPQDLDAYWQGAQKRIEGAPDIAQDDRAWIRSEVHKELEAYFTKEATQAYIAGQFARVSEWAKNNGIPAGQIFLGEFDASRQGPKNDGGQQDSRLRWLADVRTEAEKRGFTWCFWGLSGEGGDGMVLVTIGNQTQIDMRTAAALGKSLYK